MIINVHAKCSDMASIVASDVPGMEYDQQVTEADYMPNGLGLGSGDYIEFNVDVETGKIIGWDSEAVKERVMSLIEKANR